MGDHAKKVMKRRDSKGVKQTVKRTKKQYKDYRTLRKQAKQRDEEQRTNREGVTYEAGAFNGLGVCSAPPQKKRKR